MGLEKILAVSGKPGLYELITQTRTGFVASSLIDGKRLSLNLRSNISLLSEIAIYTLSEEVPLREVFKKIQEKENGKKTAVSHKDENVKLEEYFFDILPDYDEDRVYVSDIKKVIRWYNLLVEKGHDNFEAEAEEGKENEKEKSKGKEVQKEKEIKEEAKKETKKKKESKKTDSKAEKKTKSTVKEKAKGKIEDKVAKKKSTK